MNEEKAAVALISLDASCLAFFMSAAIAPLFCSTSLNVKVCRSPIELIVKLAVPLSFS